MAFPTAPRIRPSRQAEQRSGSVLTRSVAGKESKGLALDVISLYLNCSESSSSGVKMALSRSSPGHIRQTCPHIEWECGHQQDILAGSVEYSYDMPRTQGSSSLFSRICLFCYREHVLVRMFSLYEIIAKYLCILFFKP